jgi:hypothetical protein
MQTEAKIFFNFIRGDPLNPLRAPPLNLDLSGEKIKARIRGQNMESLMGVSPYLRLIYGPNTGPNMGPKLPLGV